MQIQTDTLELSQFTVTVQHDREASVAEIVGDFNGETRVWTGSCKVTPGDKFNREVANFLAVGRAFEKASRQLLRQGNGLVKHADDIVEIKKAQRLAPAPEPQPARRRRFRRG